MCLNVSHVIMLKENVLHPIVGNAEFGLQPFSELALISCIAALKAGCYHILQITAVQIATTAQKSTTIGIIGNHYSLILCAITAIANADCRGQN